MSNPHSGPVIGEEHGDYPARVQMAVALAHQQVGQAFRVDLPGRLYHATPGLSRSHVKCFAEEPLAFYRHYVCQPGQPEFLPSPETSKPMDWGTCLEHWLFYHELPGNSKVIIPAEVLASNGARLGNAWKAWRDAKAAEGYSERDMVTAPEYAAMTASFRAARRNLVGHHDAKALWYAKGNITHPSFFWVDEETGRLMKVQLDLVCFRHQAIVDLKSAERTDPYGFGRAVTRFRYDWQAYLYPEAFYRWCGERFRFIALVVRNKGTHNVETYDLYDYVDDARDEFRSYLGTLNCLLNDPLALADSSAWKSPTNGRIVPLRKWRKKA